MLNLVINRLDNNSKFLNFEVKQLLLNCKVSDIEIINIYVCYNNNLQPYKDSLNITLTKQESYMYYILSNKLILPILENNFEYNYIIIELLNNSVIIGRYQNNNCYYYNNSKIIYYEDIEEPFQSLLLNYLD